MKSHTGGKLVFDPADCSLITIVGRHTMLFNGSASDRRHFFNFIEKELLADPSSVSRDTRDIILMMLGKPPSRIRLKQKKEAVIEDLRGWVHSLKAIERPSSNLSNAVDPLRTEYPTPEIIVKILSR